MDIIKPGTLLSNGATVLQQRTKPNGDNYVLALYEGEFVTWFLTGAGVALSGDYHGQHLCAALESLANR